MGSGTQLEVLAFDRSRNSTSSVNRGKAECKYRHGMVGIFGGGKKEEYLLNFFLSSTIA